MVISEYIRDVEVQLSEKGIAVQDVCDAAKLNRATYQRWKSGEAKPLWESWQRFLEAVEPHMTDR